MTLYIILYHLWDFHVDSKELWDLSNPGLDIFLDLDDGRDANW